MTWVYLILAGISEVVWAVGLKYSEGFTRLWPSVWTIIVMLLSFFLLAQAMRGLPLGTAYAIWTGIGAVGTVLYGMWRLGEPSDPRRLACIALIVIGIIGLKVLTTPAS